MKKFLSIFLLLTIILLTGCGVNSDRTVAATAVPTAVPAIADQSAATPTPDTVHLPAEKTGTSNPAIYDVDLTNMGATMVYSYVFSIVSEPAQYVGQRFKMQGTYEMTYWSATELNYHFVVVADATACCAQGIEFVLDEGLSYPAEGDQIEITGTFGSYEELDETYYYIQADSIRSWE